MMKILLCLLGLLCAVPVWADGVGLFTAAQARAGRVVYLADCASCHGAALQGISGPKLVGRDFAGPEDGFTVGLVFTNLWEGTPAGAPDSLSRTDYVDVMAYLMQANGYPAGKRALTFDAAGASKAAFVSLVP
jgi:mono/diheme cytochrome c family protein